MSGAEQRLSDLLGAPVPPSVAALDESALAELADIVAAARRHQAESLRDAFEATLRHVPFPARGIVKKVLLG